MKPHSTFNGIRRAAVALGLAIATLTPIGAGSAHAETADSMLANARIARTCLNGFVWREVNSTDYVCVVPNSRTRVWIENQQAAQHRVFAGLFSTSNCLPGYVWREAVPGDRVCVTPASRELARWENSVAHLRRVGR